MTNNKSSSKSSSRQEDDRRAETSKGRVDSIHGGQVVEAVTPEELELMNDPECQHERLVRDPSETEFNAFVCANPDCGIVAIYDKQ